MENSKLIKRISLAASSLAISAMTTITSFAGPGEGEGESWDAVKIDDSLAEGNPFEKAGSLVGFFIAVYKVVGVVLIIVGVGQMLMGFMREDPDKMNAGLKLFFIGFALAALKFILNAFGVISLG